MHEEGIQRLRGHIEERKEFVNKINKLQKQVESGGMSLETFYREVIAMKHNIENKVM